MSIVNKNNESKNVLSIEQVRKHFIKNPTNLHILTPCYGSQVFVSFTETLIRTIKILEKLGIGVTTNLLGNESLVQRARNRLVCSALKDNKMTHVLFIDADITWDPNDIVRLLFYNKDIIGAAYPFKHYFLERLEPKFMENTEKRRNELYYNKGFDKTEFLKHNLLNYNLNYKKDGNKIENNLMEVKHIPTGFMMIKRHVFKKMMERFDIGYVSFEDGKDTQYYAFFDCCIKNNRYLSEDWFFCDRWTNMGGKIYVVPDITIAHTGLCHYKGRLLSVLS